MAVVAVAWLALGHGAEAVPSGFDPFSAKAPAMTKATVAQRRSAKSAYGRLPLSFAANRGQVDHRARFVARGATSSVFLTRDGAVMSLKEAALRMSFAGSDAGAPRGTAKLPGTVSSLIGNDPSKWVHGAPTYARVAYPHVWNGIDGVFYGNGNQLEYDLRVAPGADPSAIALRFDGQRRAHLTGNGDLLLQLPGGSTVRQRAPVSYQRLDGRRAPVASRFTLGEGGRVGITVGAYDHGRPLVIDPSVVYSTYLGGAGNEQARAVAVGPDDSAYLTGYTQSTDFPTTTGVLKATRATTDFDAFVVKLDPAGTAETYGTYLGGSGAEFGTGVAVDATGSAYVTGSTQSTNFPTTAGAVKATRATADYDAFAVKLNAGGTMETYGTYLGGTGDENGRGIAVDGTGSAYLTGNTVSTDFPTTAGPTYGGGGFQDAFAVKLNPLGTAEIYGTYLGGSYNDIGYGIAVDGTGSAYVTGSTESPNFPTTAGTLKSTRSTTDPDAFAVKLNPLGTGETYGTYLGGAGAEAGYGIAVDASGSAYLTGYTQFNGFPTTAGALRTTKASSDVDGFAVKLDPAGVTETYGTLLGGAGIDYGFAIAVDATGSAYLTGYTQSNDFPTTAPALKSSRTATDQDAYLVRLNATGTAETFGTYLGGTGSDQGLGLALDATSGAYIAGVTSSTDFPTTAGTLKSSRTTTDQDVFVTKFETATAVRWRGASARVRRRGGVRITWRTGRDTDTLGFAVVRIRHGQRVRLTRKLIPGGATRPKQTFTFVDRRGRAGDRYVVVERSLDGGRSAHVVGRAR